MARLKAQGVITSVYLKDVADPAWADDPAIKEFLAFNGKIFFPEGNPKGGYSLYAYTGRRADAGVEAMRRRLLARENHAAGQNLHDVEVPALLPGSAHTSPTNHPPLPQMQLQRLGGERVDQVREYHPGGEYSLNVVPAKAGDP